ncbi:MAG: glycosyltransferase family 39 protein [Candidatus Aenigmarchaeota archaeon]|nr:glycosyltransferase family 39 protein [Candidatus Aenigmarchaeota archaeon]
MLDLSWIRKHILLLLIILYLLIELTAITNFFNHDELLTVSSVRDGVGLHYYDNAGPPLAYASLYPAYILFGLGEWQLRLVSVLFGIGTIYLVWSICKRYYSKKTAILSVLFLILTFTFFESSLSVYIDGTKLTFFAIATLYSFLRLEETGSRKWILLTGVSVAFGMFTKNLFLFIAPVLLIYIAIKRNVVLLKNTLLVVVIALAIYSVYPLTYYAAGKTYFEDNFALPWSQTLSSLPSSENTCRYEYYCFSTRANASIGHYLFGFSRALVFMTPLVFFLLFFLVRKSYKNIFFIQAIVYLIIIELLISPLLDTSRYILQLLPTICILAGIVVSETTFKKEDILKISVFFLIFFIGFALLNTQKGDYLDIIHDKEQIKGRIASLDVFFYSPITLTIFPTTFYINMLSVVLVFSISFLLLVLFMIKKKTYAMIFLLALILAFNVFLLSEASLHLTQPNPEAVRADMLSYIRNNRSMDAEGVISFSEPIYINSRFFGFYLNDKYDYIDMLYDFKQSKNESISGGYQEPYHVTSNSNDPSEIASLMKKLETGGTIFYFDQAILFKNTLQYEELSSKCDLLKTFSDKGAEMGYIFDCSKLKR